MRQRFASDASSNDPDTGQRPCQGVLRQSDPAIVCLPAANSLALCRVSLRCLAATTRVPSTVPLLPARTARHMVSGRYGQQELLPQNQETLEALPLRVLRKPCPEPCPSGVPQRWTRQQSAWHRCWVTAAAQAVLSLPLPAQVLCWHHGKEQHSSPRRQDTRHLLPQRDPAALGSGREASGDTRLGEQQEQGMEGSRGGTW